MKKRKAVKKYFLFFWPNFNSLNCNLFCYTSKIIPKRTAFDFWQADQSMGQVQNNSQLKRYSYHWQECKAFGRCLLPVCLWPYSELPRWENTWRVLTLYSWSGLGVARRRCRVFEVSMAVAASKYRRARRPGAGPKQKRLSGKRRKLFWVEESRERSSGGRESVGDV